MSTTTPQTQIAGQFVWRELHTPDVEAAKAFYAEVFGWSYKDGALSGADAFVYHEIKAADGAHVGGIMAQQAGDQAPPHWGGYVAVDDVDAAVARATAAGGRVYVEAMDIPTVGRFAVVADPQGAVTSPFTYAGEAYGGDPWGAGAFCWEQLTTTDQAAAKAFYKAVYGWGDMAFGDGSSGMSVFTLQGGERQIASMMTAPPGVPAHWLTFVVVDAIAAANERCAAAGGQVMVARVDVPGIGAFSVLQDPQGAVIAAFEGLADAGQG